MMLSLLRHGIAEDTAATDYDRRLTREGCEQVERVIYALGATGWAPGAILHSPYLRTTETAELVHARFPKVPIEPLEDLAIGSIEAILRACTRFDHPLLVGHEPTMGNLTSRLIGAPMGAIRFDRAGFALLDIDRIPTTRPARLVAFIQPPWMG